MSPNEHTTDQDESNGNDRRKFLRKSAITAGFAATGGSVLPSLTKACDHSEGDYQDENYTHWMGEEAQIAKSQCDNNFNSGTRIDSGGTLIYWESENWSSGKWSHHFSNHAHAEHFNEDNCEWVHGPGLYQQRWRARDEVSGNNVDLPQAEDWVGAWPAVSEDGNYNFSNTAYTGLSLALTYYWPATAPVVNAYSIVNALATDLQGSRPDLWDAQHNWDYGYNYKDCTSHYVYFNSNGDTGEADVYTQDGFWSDYHYAEIAHHDSISSPSTNDTASYETSSTTSGDGTEAPRADVGVGDVISPDGDRKVRVESIRTQTRQHSGGGKQKIDTEQYRQRFPERYKQMEGEPEYRVRLPGTSRVTSLTGTIIN